MKNSGGILIKLRKAKNIKQKEIAEILNISASAYNKIEKGLVEPTLKHLITLSEYFEVSIDEIVHGKEKESTESTENSTTGAGADADNDCISLKPFGKYAGTIRVMLEEMKKESCMHHILGLYFLEKQKQAAADAVKKKMFISAADEEGAISDWPR